MYAFKILVDAAYEYLSLMTLFKVINGDGKVPNISVFLPRPIVNKKRLVIFLCLPKMVLNKRKKLCELHMNSLLLLPSGTAGGSEHLTFSLH